jgi:pyrimidine-nucleoside phosphorylase
MLLLSGKASNLEQGEALCDNAIASGRALELFLANVDRQGGNRARLLDLRGVWRSAHKAELRASESGIIQSIDAWKIGLAGVSLGVGRNTTADLVGPDVGFIFERKKGQKVEAGSLIATLYGKDESSLEQGFERAKTAVRIGSSQPETSSLILKEISAP